MFVEFLWCGEGSLLLAERDDIISDILMFALQVPIPGFQLWIMVVD